MIEINPSPRVIAIASVGCIVAGVVACGSEPTATVTAEPPQGAAPVAFGSPPAVTAVAAAPVPAGVAPGHGGTIVMAGSYPVEVVPHESGQVYAYVLGDAPPPADGTELTVMVPVSGGVRPVELAWEPGEARWGGRVRRAEIVPGPIDVVIVAGGARYTGHLATFVVLPAIVVIDTSPSVVVIEDDHHEHHKHRKHRGRHGHWH